MKPRTSHWWQFSRLCLMGACLVTAGITHAVAEEAAAQADTPKTQQEATAAQPNSHLGIDSGLPIPRFASTGSKETNLRSGPGTRYPILWVYRQPHVPMEIIDEHENWRKVRDPQGDTGWLHRVLLNGTRQVIFLSGLHDVRENPEPNAKVIFRAKEGVHGKALHCIPDWCQLLVNDHQGWAAKTSLFGVYPQEVF
jgi:SH3-like domain-containing protein